MIRWRGWPALMVVFGCMSAPEEIVPVQSYRATDAPISSIALFDPALAAGNWVEIARFVPEGQTTCGLCSVRFTPDGQGLQLQSTGQGRDLLVPVGPGRLQSAANAAAPWWVLWVDADYRTLVVGTPNGSLGFILNRTPDISQDRKNAAREILDWAGYDLRRLVEVSL